MGDWWRPENFYVGGGATETVMSPLGAIILLVAAAFILSLPRKYVIAPLLLALFCVPMGQTIVVAGLHLMPVRILTLSGWIRIALKNLNKREPVFANGFNSVDKAYLWLCLFHAIAFVVLWHNGSALINQFGYLWTGLGGYFLLRHLVRDEEDIYRTNKVLVCVACVSAAEMIYEQITVHNLFGMLIGGMSPTPEIRLGKIRSQAAFGHSIPAGMFGAILLPLCLLLWKGRRARLFAAIGIIAASIMVYTPGSSTPFFAIGAVVIGLCFWPLRERMKMIRWGIVGGLCALQLLMKAPVWMLIARADLIGGSSSYHRAELVDHFIRNFFDWWLVGTKDMANWGLAMFDLSDEYVAQGESGGLLAFICFLLVIIRCYRYIGSAREVVHGSRRQEWVVWLLGVVLFSQTVGFFGISYWDQMMIVWWVSLAIICAGTISVLKQKQASVNSEPPGKDRELSAAELDPICP